jgi:exopolysaccharide biosynthesis operon protein EpsL
VFGAVAHGAELSAADPFQFYLMDRYAYDDNLFRVAEGRFANDPTLVPPESEEDYVNRASAGVRVRLDHSRQVFHLDARVDDVRYAENDYLDYTGGNADLLWDWQVGRRLSGKLYGTFDRQQASLANYTFTGRDIVDAAGYGGEFRWAIGSRWRLLAAGAAADTDHSADVRRVQNFESTTGRGGIEYQTPAGMLIGVEYRVTSADFPIAEALAGGAPRGYEEQVPGVRVILPFTEKTRLIARAGYLDRDYDNPESGDYSGGIWNATLQWEPRAKISFDFKGWHELRAYTDAELDYFVADGVSITPKWQPRTTLELAATYSYEKQDYTGAAPLLIESDAQREDKVQSALFSIDYTPRDMISLGLAYRWTDRESNRPFRDYGANLVSAEIKLTF